MKTLTKYIYLSIFALSVALPACSSAPPAAASSTTTGNGADNNFTKQLSAIMLECQSITPGMTRAQLLKVFMPQGGISTPSQQTFVSRECAYIKVDVTFRLSDPNQRAAEDPVKQATDERPTDIITSISKPYLEWLVTD